MYHAEELQVGSVVESRKNGKIYVVNAFHDDKLHGKLIELQDEEDLGQLEHATYRDIKMGYKILEIEPEILEQD